VSSSYLTDLPSTSDEAALRAKVEEAMSVYDEYVKNKEGEPEEKAPKEEAKEEKA
jgi:polyadenylate-binding protein